MKGTDTYPDATFTLRLAFGQVKGYKEDGKEIPPWTTIGGAFQHADDHGSKPPFELPSSWLKPPKPLNMDTPFNFVCTADIIGGNSGSPVINKAGEYVRHHLRRQHPIAGARFHLHRRAGPGRERPFQCHSGSPAKGLPGRPAGG